MTERLAEEGDVLEAELDPEVLEREESVEQTSELSGRGWSECARGPDRGPFGNQLGAHESETPRDRRFQIPPVHYQIEHPVLGQELAALEPFRQLLPDGLLDDARSREADERLRFGDVQITQHRKAGSD